MPLISAKTKVHCNSHQPYSLTADDGDIEVFRVRSNGNEVSIGTIPDGETWEIITVSYQNFIYLEPSTTNVEYQLHRLAGPCQSPAV